MTSFLFHVLSIFVSLPYASPVEFFMVGSVNGAVPEKRKNFELKSADTLILYPVAVKDSLFYSAADSFVTDDGIIHQVKAKPSKLKELKKGEVSWFEISPVLKTYDNLNPPGGKLAALYYAPIDYTVSFTKKEKLNEEKSFREIYENDFPGTYYLTFRFGDAGQVRGMIEGLSFSDIKPLHKRYPYQVIQVTLREDDSYLGYLSELFNTPRIILPKRLTSGDHQTDIRVGSDCAEFAVYGKRRQGFDVKYVRYQNISHYLEEISTSPLFPGKDGVYADSNGNMIAVGEGGLQPGDVVHFGEHVSVFKRDLGFPGILDKYDEILQCCDPSPQLTIIGKSGFFEMPIRVFKWKEDLKPLSENPWDP